jgi:pyroglutamyl-peptidase
VFLHLGVHASSKEFNLEQVGYNLANFSIPDERGWVAKDEIIDSEEDASLNTALPLEKMLSSLMGVNTKAQISMDPGRYICNYVYFHSLRWTKIQLEKKSTQVHVF